MGNNSEKRRKCQQCDKDAIVQTEAGLILCLDCFTKLQEVIYLQNLQLMAQANQLMDQVRLVTGLDISMPKYEIPKPSFNSTNLNISDSVIGTINTGYAKDIVNNMTNIKNQGNEELLDKMSDFLKAIAEEKEMSTKIKDEIFERWAFINSQMTIKSEFRKKGMVKESLDKIRLIADDYIRIKEIWILLHPLINSILG